MSEWWTYRPSDFLMFSARTWARLVERTNAAGWPVAHLLAGLLGAALLACLARPTAPRARWVAAALAVAWLWVGAGFHARAHAEVNTAGPVLALAWVLQACLLAGFGAAARGPAPAPRASVRVLGGLVAAAGVIAYPLLAVPAGLPWRQAEMAGLLPEPTALATLGFVLAAPLRHRALLAVLPALATVQGLGTRWLLALQ